MLVARKMENVMKGRIIQWFIGSGFPFSAAPTLRSAVGSIVRFRV